MHRNKNPPQLFLRTGCKSKFWNPTQARDTDAEFGWTILRRAFLVSKLQQSALDSFCPTEKRKAGIAPAALLFPIISSPRLHPVAPPLGSLRSAAKVNNECMFFLHITRPWWCWYLVSCIFISFFYIYFLLFYFSRVITLGRDGRPQTASAV